MMTTVTAAKAVDPIVADVMTADYTYHHKSAHDESYDTYSVPFLLHRLSLNSIGHLTQRVRVFSDNYLVYKFDKRGREIEKYRAMSDGTKNGFYEKNTEEAYIKATYTNGELNDARYIEIYDKKGATTLQADQHFSHGKRVGAWSTQRPSFTEAYYAEDGSELGFEIVYDGNDATTPTTFYALKGQYAIERVKSPEGVSYAISPRPVHDDASDAGIDMQDDPFKAKPFTDTQAYWLYEQAIKLMHETQNNLLEKNLNHYREKITTSRETIQSQITATEKKLDQLRDNYDVCEDQLLDESQNKKADINKKFADYATVIPPVQRFQAL